MKRERVSSVRDSGVYLVGMYRVCTGHVQQGGYLPRGVQEAYIPGRCIPAIPTRVHTREDTHPPYPPGYIPGDTPLIPTVHTRRYTSHTHGCTQGAPLPPPGVPQGAPLPPPGVQRGVPLIPTGVQREYLSYPRVCTRHVSLPTGVYQARLPTHGCTAGCTLLGW